MAENSVPVIQSENMDCSCCSEFRLNSNNASYFRHLGLLCMTFQHRNPNGRQEVTFFACPKCHDPYTLPVGDGSGVRADFVLTLSMKGWPISPPAIGPCQVCESPIPTQMCNHCHQRFCDQCTFAHANMKRTRHHSIGCVEFNHTKHGFPCESHYAEYFSCDDCDTRTCSVCSVQKHVRHELRPIGNLVEDRMGHLLGIDEDIDCLLSEAIKRMEDIRKLQKMINNRIKICQRNIGTRSRSLREFVALSGSRMLDYMMNIKNKCLFNFKSQKKALLEEKRKFDKYRSNLQERLDRADENFNPVPEIFDRNENVKIESVEPRNKSIVSLLVPPTIVFEPFLWDSMMNQRQSSHVLIGQIKGKRKFTEFFHS